MQVAYKIEALPEMSEVDLQGVPLETASSCPVCGSQSGLIEVARLHGSLLTSRCDSCGHLFHRTRPTADWYAGWYRSSWDGAQSRQPSAGAVNPAATARLRTLVEQRARSVARALLPSRNEYNAGRELFDFCRPVLKPSDRVLDVGCGYGSSLVPFVEFGCSAFGIEASPHRAASAARHGIRTINTPVEQLEVGSFDTRFNLVISNHVFEHVFDPHAFLAAVARVLEPGGWICLTVPNQENDFLLQQFFFALHIHCFSPSSLGAALRRHGFVTHRLLQEHQVRVLAQYQPATAVRAGGRCNDALSTEAFTENITQLTLGDQYDRFQGKDMYCRWNAQPQATRRVYDVRYTTEQPAVAAGDKLLRLSVSGDRALPITFVKADAPDRAVPFWAK